MTTALPLTDDLPPIPRALTRGKNRVFKRVHYALGAKDSRAHWYWHVYGSLWRRPNTIHPSDFLRRRCAAECDAAWLRSAERHKKIMEDEKNALEIANPKGGYELSKKWWDNCFKYGHALSASRKWRAWGRGEELRLRT